jgi:hypothetical protein
MQERVKNLCHTTIFNNLHFNYSLEVRVKQLEKQVHEEFRYNETLLARLIPFPRKEAAKKEAAEKEAADKAVENHVARVIFIMSYFYF